MHAAQVAAHLEARGWRVKRSGHEWRCQCPAHGGSGLNLQVYDGERAVVVECWSHHCEFAAIVAAMGLSERDLSFETHRANGPRPQATVYPYRDEQGRVLYEVRRTADKQFSMWLPGAERPGIGTTPRVLFGLPELLATAPGDLIGIAEGEKCAIAVAALGLPCTTNPNGAGKWRAEYTAWLAEHLPGRKYLVLPDNDEAGKRHAVAVGEALAAAGLKAVLADLGPLKPAGDVVDWIAAGGTAEQLRAMAAEKPHPLDLKVLDGEALEAESLPTPDALIPHLLYRGFVTLLAGDSKLGKSSLELRAVLAAAAGGWWLDRERRGENRLLESRILYVNFEDPLFVTRERARRMMAPETLPKNFLTMPPPYGTSLPELLEWLHGAHERLGIEAVVLDPIAIAAEWTDETDNAEVARSLKPLARLAAETMLAILLAHHVTKKPGQYGLNIRGASAIKANVLGYLVLEREKELFKLSGVNKLSGEWDVTLDRGGQEWGWWIVESRAGSTRTAHQALKESALADILLMLGQEGVRTTEQIAETLMLKRRTCLNYLTELSESGLILAHPLPGGALGGRPKTGWIRAPERK